MDSSEKRHPVTREEGLTRRRFLGATAAATGLIAFPPVRVAARPVCAVDVLVVGGGIQGLLVLRRLVSAGYSTVLVESGPLAGRQTGHSHAAIHRGYLSQDRELAARMRRTTPFWDRFVRDHGVQVEAPTTVIGFGSSTTREEWTAAWRAPGLALRFQSSAAPREFGSSAAVSFVRAPEYALNSRSLVRALALRLDRHIGQVAPVGTFQLAATGPRVQRVILTAPNRRELAVEPRFVVFAAGEGNAQLVGALDAARQTAGQVQPARDKIQRVKDGYMLVVRGRADRLPPMAAFFPDHNRMVWASRRTGAEVAWLVDGSGPDERAEWIQEMVEHLRQVAPRAVGNPAALRWGVYDAPKAEPAGHPGAGRQERVDSFGYANLAVAWPVKLTLAPFAGDAVVAAVRRAIPNPRRRALPAAWLAFRRPVPIASERWEQTPLQPWSEFAAAHGIQ